MNPFILPILPLWSTTDWFPLVRRSLHWAPSPQWGEPLTTVRVAILWRRRHSFCHMRLGVNFMSWSNFCVLVWLSLPWRDFITLSDIIRTCGHVMDDVITLWWSRESWYDCSPSWTKFLSWWHLVCLGVILYLGAINRILVWFFFALDTMFVWWDYISVGVVSYLGAINCIMVWFSFILLGSLILVWFCLIWCNFISWCD